MKKLGLEKIIGKQHGRLTPQKEVFIKGKYRYFECTCSCGKTTIVKLSNLRNGETKSCGCLAMDTRKITVRFAQSKAIKHGMTDTPLYNVYKGILSRCKYRTSEKSYRNYWGRGIKCMWNSFEEFYKDMGPTYKYGLEIDRIDNDGHYCKENCRWITHKENNNNRRDNHNLTHLGITLTVSQWAEKLGIKTSTIFARIRYGYSIDNILSTEKLYGLQFKKNIQNKSLSYQNKCMRYETKKLRVISLKSAYPTFFKRSIDLSMNKFNLKMHIIFK